MKKIKDFFSKHGLVAFIVLFLIMGMRGCVKNSRISRLEKEKTKLEASVDSLNNLQLLRESARPIALIKIFSRA